MSIPRPAFHLAAALLVITYPIALPGDEVDPIERCASLPTDGKRIACLEAVIRGQPDTTGAATTPAALQSETGDGSAPNSDEGNAASTESAGHMAKGDPEAKNVVAVTVTSIGADLHGRLIFRTEDGQVWQQVDQRTGRFPDTPFQAEIRPAMMGSYFIKAATGTVSIRVRKDE